MTLKPELITSPLDWLFQGVCLQDLVSCASQTPAYALEKPTPIDSCLDGVDIINGIIKNRIQLINQAKGSYDSSGHSNLSPYNCLYMKCLREVIGVFPESSAKVRLQF